MDRRQQTWQQTEFGLGLVLLLAFGAAAIVFVAWPYLGHSDASQSGIAPPRLTALPSSPSCRVLGRHPLVCRTAG